MHRTNIYLEARQTAALDEMARAQGLTRAEVIRRLVDAGLSLRTARLQDDLGAIEQSFGALADRDADGADRERTARDEHLDVLWGR